MMIPSGISKRFTISGVKMKIKLRGRLDGVVISERGMIKEGSECTFLGTDKDHPLYKN